ncbi:hypothetical protein CVT24_007007 [Panaeolus cyanescens]|uniref:OTU domain-containing protein n=1 Tax=Panaeolus cyanescens TaxID=181874 RepID=A0A409YKD2_9AGAR|nr:hypothetical protein CVT24_007007 [Panaeolus cyanescens]
MAAKKKRSAKQQPLPELPVQPLEQDDDLMNDLLAQLESRDQTVKEQSAQLLNDMDLNSKADAIEKTNPKQDAKARFKARQARKAALLAKSYGPDDPENQERLQREAKEEEESIRKTCKSLGLEIHEANGHCLFSAIADQLSLLHVVPPAQATYANVRLTAANYIHSHRDDFLPFLPSEIGEDGHGAQEPGLMGDAEFESYCNSVRDTAMWGGEPEIVALSKALNLPIHVVQGSTPPIVTHHPTGQETPPTSTQPAIKISYHRRMYGLGEHYNSLRPVAPN